MTKQIPYINGSPTSDTGDYVGFVDVDQSIDANWRIKPVISTLDGRNVIPNFLTVNNINNQNIVTITYGPFSWEVPQYNRLTIPLTLKAGDISVAIPGGVCRCYFSEKHLGVDARNDYAIAQQAGLGVVYTFITILNSRAQAAADGNKNIRLSNAVAQNYTLQDIALNSVPNGFYNPTIKNIGAGRWSIVPTVGDGINGGIYTNAAPLLLSQNDWIDLRCDGAAGGWEAKGYLTFETPEQTMTNAAHIVVAHGLGYDPGKRGNVEGFLRCKTAEGNFIVNDEIHFADLSEYPNNNTGIFNSDAVVTDATNLDVRGCASTTTFGATNKTTGAFVVLTPANWRKFWRLSVII